MIELFNAWVRTHYVMGAQVATAVPRKDAIAAVIAAARKAPVYPYTVETRVEPACDPPPYNHVHAMPPGSGYVVDASDLPGPYTMGVIQRVPTVIEQATKAPASQSGPRVPPPPPPPPAPGPAARKAIPPPPPPPPRKL